jgi:hypothetical protein
LRDLVTLADVDETDLREGLIGEDSREDLGELVPEASADSVAVLTELTGGLMGCVVPEVCCSIARLRAAVLPTAMFDPSSNPSSCGPTGGGSLSDEDAMVIV